MARFTLSVACDNAAFEDNPAPELARILRLVADRLEVGEDGGAVSDINGNRVGRYELERD